MKTYIVPLMILDAPVWWRNYITTYRGDNRTRSVKESMSIVYNADMYIHGSDASKITFNDDSLHMLFMLEWA